MAGKTKASRRTEKANEARRKPSADQDDPRADAAARAADGTAARARARCNAASPATCICVCIAPSLIAAIAFCMHAPRPLQMASPHALPHARRADRPIKKKTQGKRNLPANEAVSKWLIIETLERATPEEIVQLAFVVCA